MTLFYLLMIYANTIKTHNESSNYFIICNVKFCEIKLKNKNRRLIFFLFLGNERTET